MKAIVCGDRNWTDKELIKEKLIEFGITELIEGECKGADKLSRQAGEEIGIVIIPVSANWDKYHRAAGPIRNSKMLTYNPEMVLAFHDDIEHSKGTKDMINKAKNKGTKVVLVSHQQTIDENPVRDYTFPCGCKILGNAPNVDKLILCIEHKSIADQMQNYAPNSAKKLLLWWEPDTKP